MSDRIESQWTNKRALDQQSLFVDEARPRKRHDADIKAPFFEDTTADAVRALQEYEPGPVEESDDTAKPPTTPQLHMRSTRVIWEQQRGWWPKHYAPDNPNCPTIRTNMKAIIRKFIRAGLDPQEMWSEEGEGGCMVKAIRESRKGVVTGRLFKKVEFPTGLQPRKTENGNAKSTIQSKTGPDARSELPTAPFSTPSYSLAHQDKNKPAPNCNDRSTPVTQSIQQVDEAHPFGIGSEKDFLAGLIDPLDATVSRLKQNECLMSIDIWRVVKLLTFQNDVHVFEPGFPSDTSPISSQQFLATQFMFFIHSGQHWSLGHLDVSAQRFCHYNPTRSIDTDTSNLENWVCKQFGLGFLYGGGIVEKECPQQNDGVNSGIVVLEVLVCLIHKREVPRELDTTQSREAFVLCLQQQHKLGLDHSWGSQLFSSPSHELRVDQGLFQMPPLSLTDKNSAAERIQNYNLSSTGHAGSSVMKGYLTAFRDSFSRAQKDLQYKNKILAARESKLSSLQFELTLLGEKLKIDIQTVKELEEQVNLSMTREWLTQCPDHNEEKNSWLNELLSNAQSTIGVTEVKDRLLRDELQALREACNQGWRDVARLENVVQTEKTFRDDLVASIKISKDDLEDVKLACAEMGSGGS